MDAEIVKGKPLTKEESKFLLDLVEKSKTITTKTTNASNNKMKNEEWIRLADHFNATANCPRTPQQLRLKWENLKKNARKRSTKIRMNQMKTGGGPADYIPPDDILDRVAGMLGSTASGFTVLFGGDRENNMYDVGYNGDSGDGGGVEDARVSIIQEAVLMPTCIEHGTVTEICQGASSGDGNPDVLISDQNVITPNKKRKITFNFDTPKTVKKKLKPDEGRTVRNNAIAEYFTAKKQCIDAKLVNINLEKENLSLKNYELRLQNQKLSLEIEKFKLELEKLKHQ